MWETFDVIMEISMITSIISQVITLLEKLFGFFSDAWDFLFPSETSAT